MVWHLSEALKKRQGGSSPQQGPGGSGRAGGLERGTERGSCFGVTLFVEKRPSGNRANLCTKEQSALSKFHLTDQKKEEN